jgi:hypothetical protein
MQVRGNHPQTGKEIDEWGCAIAWGPVLMIENSKMQRETGAAVESFRNEMVKANEASVKVLAQTLSYAGNSDAPLLIKDAQCLS